MNYSAVYNQIATLFILIILGYIFAKVNIMDEGTILSFNKFILKVSFPALIISAMMIPRTLDKLKGSLLMLVIAFITYAGSYYISRLVTKIIKAPSNQKGVFEFGMIFSNVGFMGFPVIATIFGKEAVFYAVIYNIAFIALTYTLGVSLIRSSDKELHFNIRSFINPGVIASVIGYAIFALAVPVPKVIKEVFTLVGNVTTPMSMLLIGAMLSDLSISETFNNWRVYIIGLVRVFVLPLMVFFVFNYILKVDNITLMGVPVIITGMPVAANAALIAKEYEGNSQVASQCVFVSTLMSVISIPVLSLLFA